MLIFFNYTYIMTDDIYTSDRKVQLNVFSSEFRFDFIARSICTDAIRFVKISFSTVGGILLKDEPRFKITLFS